jgi:hypothetical protein
MKNKTKIAIASLLLVALLSIAFAYVLSGQVHNTGRIVGNVNLQISITAIDWGELQIGQTYGSDSFTVANIGLSNGYVWWNASVPQGLTLFLYNYGEPWNQKSKIPLPSNSLLVVYAELTPEPNANLRDFSFDINFYLSDSP